VINTVSGDYYGDDDVDPCFADAATAAAAAQQIREALPDGWPMQARHQRRTHLCVTVTCDDCGADAEDGGHGLHFDPATVDRALADISWTVVDARDLCADCSRDVPPPAEKVRRVAARAGLAS
jgi:hypothetical protein